MKRHLYNDLLTWKKKKNRKPLVLQGARQVGKTYLLMEFGEKEYADTVYFNFEQIPELGSLFETSLNPIRILESLELFVGRKIEPGATLIFFDEIQACQKAVTSLKYFYEQTPEYHIVAAGSLLGVSVTRNSSFPVGKINFKNLYPLSFHEYLNAAGEEMLLELLENKQTPDQITELLHNKLMALYKKFLFLGGMPEVISRYLNNNDIEEVREIQKDILEAYKRDFSKYTTPSESIRISEIWNSIPIQLAKENKKFKYSDIIKGGRSSKFENAIEWLKNAGLIYIMNNIKTPKMPLSGYSDKSRFKLFLLDSGLLGAMLNVHSSLIVLENKLFSEYNGAFVQNFVASEFLKCGIDDLFYWTSNFDAEIDFIIAKNSEIIPIEVKSGMSRRTKSLRVYSEKYKARNLIRFSPRNFTKDSDLLNIPLYAVSTLENFIE